MEAEHRGQMDHDGAQRKESLVAATLLSLAAGTAVVIVVMTMLVYGYLCRTVEKQELRSLARYVRQRVEREQTIFGITEQNQAVVRDDMIRRLRALGDRDPVEEFEALFRPYPDGVWRKHVHAKKGDEVTTAYIDESLTIDADIRRRMVVFEALAGLYGPVWNHLFPNIYIFSEEDNMEAQYWPERADWDYIIGPDYDMSSEEWAYVSNKEYDPERKAVWTGLYWDEVAEIWMVSCSTPVDIDGRHVGSIGQDIYLNQLLERSIDAHLDGAYNVIFRADGRLIAHPERMEESRKAEGNYDILASGDPLLKRIYRAVTEHPGEDVVALREDGLYLAVAPIDGPGWFFVVVYPRALITQQALLSALIMFALGCASLLAEVVILYLVLRKRVGQPLNRLTEATELMAAGQPGVRLPKPRRDEFGRLAETFNVMAERVENLIAGLNNRIADLNRVQASLRESERNYREIFNSTNDAVFLHDAATGEVLDVNETTERMFGYSRDEALSISVGKMSADDPACDEREAISYIRKAVAEGPQLFEWHAKHKDGHEFWIEVGLRNTEIGGQGRVLASVRDITERKNLELQLLQAQKMEAIGQLAGGVAHDFNNLLQAIIGYNEMALEEAEPGSSLHDDLEQVSKACQRAATLVRQLLAFSRRQVLCLEYLHLSHVVQEMVKMVSRVIGENIQLKVTCDSEGATVRADRNQMEQILMNLCVNARDAMPNGGTLTVDVSSVELDDAFCSSKSWARPGRFVVLTVADTGCGMPPDVRRRVFEPFFTTKGLGRGTGLGLSTVYGIVHQHDGMIGLESVLGEGTTFRVYLPEAEGAAEAPPSAEG